MNAPPVQYAKTRDGYSIAYCVSGDGEPVVFMPFRFNNVYEIWRTSWGHSLFEALAQRFQVIQYDSRGQGMSVRGLPKSFAMDDYELDLEAVVENLGLGRFVLYAETVQGHPAVRFAVKHPELVRGLILYDVAFESEQGTAPEMGEMEEMARTNWDTFLHIVGSSFAIEGTRVDFAYLQSATTQEDFLRTAEARRQSTIADVLSSVRSPTLVVATRTAATGGPISPTLAIGQALASRIPDARLLPVDGSGSIFFANGTEPPAIVSITEDFLAALPPREYDPGQGLKPGVVPLSQREIEVLRLLAAGKSNQQIADELVISLNTVNRHVSNIYAKTGAANRAEAVGYAHRHGLAN